MKALAITVLLWAVLVTALLTGAAVDGAASPTRPSPRADAVTDLGKVGMLDADLRMLERMRVSVSPQMSTMISVDPMWVDPEMIRAQEQYQAQLDRMIGRR